MFKCTLFRKWEVDHTENLKTVSCQATLDDPYIGLTPWPLLRVIRGHMRSNAFFFAYNFWQNRDRAVGWSQWISLAETHWVTCNMTYLGHHDLTWPWLEVKFGINFFWVNMHVFWRVLATGTLWRPNLVSSFLSLNIICKKNIFV